MNIPSIHNSINQLFKNVLNRLPNNKELKYYTHNITVNSLNFVQLRSILYRSTEYVNQNINYINISLYLGNINIFLNNEKKGGCKCKLAELNFKIKKLWNGVWNILHYLSYSIKNNDDIEKLSTCINTLILPCEHCQKHFVHYKSVHPFPNDRESIIHWFIDLHNDINVRNKKKTFTRHEVDAIYNK
jgi:hypothetical protein